MGNCAKNSDSKKTQSIDDQLAKETIVKENQLKLLLLGSGDSGKSTILRQIQISHVHDFTDQERREFQQPIYLTILEGIQAIINAADLLNIPLNQELQPHIEKVMEATDLSPDLYQDFQQLWNDDSIQQIIGRANEFQLHDSTQYYFGNLDRLFADDYLPTNEDILRARIRTTGIIELSFEIEGTKFLLFDVGGQRNERKKWIHCFSSVNAIIFCVSLSEYDQTLFEDNQKKRMEESLMLFSEICNSRWFQKTTMILFFNKKDLFQKKIQNKDLKVVFDDYEGGRDYENATKFIADKFKSLNETHSEIFSYFTCATDSSNFSQVFVQVKNTILSEIAKQM
ncbi:guanine nucleotide-binding protein g(o) subunit alpha [Anaeramoeba ignava]|uniref:Guanine nucleotide-binding protein g(O) subunit alpha n=1 Tax=Anaeramoeba ignava TaxID=1746090 RepID=A0A9Q0L7E2_ANAIG|nr:guanine nucleotide-binding protein g(o) subunit alpha [Anaeramoeba ignava]